MAAQNGSFPVLSGRFPVLSGRLTHPVFFHFQSYLAAQYSSTSGGKKKKEENKRKMAPT